MYFGESTLAKLEELYTESGETRLKCLEALKPKTAGIPITEEKQKKQ